MELSQSALAMLLVGGFPAGVALNLVYVLIDIESLQHTWMYKLLVNVKDFIFILVAGLVAVLTVYYVNNGEFRYMVLVGMLCGFLLSHVTLGKLALLVKNAILKALGVPVTWLWRITIGKLCEKVRIEAMQKNTVLRMEEIIKKATNGFEN